MWRKYICAIYVYLLVIYTKGLTWSEASSKEHVKEFFRCNIRLKTSVEIKSSMSVVTWAAGILCSTDIILPLLVWVTEHCISISNLWRRTKTAFIVLYFLFINVLDMVFQGSFTFKSLSCSWCMVFVRVEFQSQFSVGLFQFLIVGIFSDTQYLIVILTLLYPRDNKKQQCLMVRRHIMPLFII